MRTLSALAAMLLLAPLALAGSSHRTHIVDDDFEVRIVHDDDTHWATYRNDSVRYRTVDPGVLAQLHKAMEPHRDFSREHSRLGREHSALGREHSALGREHSRLGREHSRVSRDRHLDSKVAERRYREIEEEQRKLEEKQRRLEEKQRALESKQRQLEDRKRDAEKEMYREIERIFEKAARQGTATRE